MVYMPTNRGFIPILAIIIVAVVVAGGGYYVYQLAGGDVRVNLPPLERGNDEGDFNTKPDYQSEKPTEPVACTMEAKICPDGSAVGRTGPNCEFAQCPTVVTKEIKPTEQELNNYIEFLKKYNMDFSDYNNSEEGDQVNLFGVQLIAQTTEAVIPEIISGLKDYVYVYRQGFWVNKGYPGKDYKDVCSSPDISTLISNLKIAVGPNSVVCNSNSDSYAASTKLPSGYFWCVDSSGYSGPGKGLSKETVCSRVNP